MENYFVRCPFHEGDNSPSLSILLHDRNGLKAGFSHCFADGTQVLTRQGVKNIESLVGRQVEIRNGVGDWEQVVFTSYGRQPIYDLTLTLFGSVYKHIYTTAEHGWFIDTKKEQGVRVLTQDLVPGNYLTPLRTRCVVSSYSDIGVIHGFIYGDGSSSKKFPQYAKVRFCTPDKKKMVKFFSDKSSVSYDGVYLRASVNGNRLGVLHWKDLPDWNAHDEYWLGFLMGLCAADGHFSPNTISLSNKSENTLSIIRDKCVSLGIMLSGDIYTRVRTGFGVTSPISTLKILVDSLPECFWDIERKVAIKQKTHYTKMRWRVVSVTPTDRVEEVYCCQTSTKSFVLHGNILTSNCFACGWSGNYKQVEKALGYPLNLSPEIRARLDESSRSSTRTTKTLRTPAAKDNATKQPIKSELPFKFSGYLKNRGIGEVVQRFNRVYENGVLYMPFFDEWGRLCGSVARGVGDRKFYQVDGSIKTPIGIEEIKNSDFVYVVEGQIDKMSLEEAGFRAVALGTVSNYKLVSRLKNFNLCFAFDNDDAGRKATDLAFQYLLQVRKGRPNLYILDYPQEFKDANEFLQAKGAEAVSDWVKLHTRRL